jgi:hypothetical protein
MQSSELVGRFAVRQWLSSIVRHPRLLDASGSGQEARGAVSTMPVPMKPGSAGLPVFGRPRTQRSGQGAGRTEEKFSYQLSAKGPGGRGGMGTA